MALRVQQRTAIENATLQGNFLGCFPNPMVGSSSSLMFVKKLAAVAVSTIVFIRNLLDSKDFVERDMSGVNVKIVKGTHKNSHQARCLTKWLEGIFDAVEHKYLRNAYLEMRDQTDALLELYILRFSFKEESNTCTIENQAGEKVYQERCRDLNGYHFLILLATYYQKSPNPLKIYIISSENLEDTANAVRSLIRNIFLISALHDPLPKDCTLSMKLEYFDEAPRDYEPPGFEPCPSSSSLRFQGSVTSYRLGIVSTPFHTMGVSSKRISSTLEEAKTHESVDRSDSVVPLLDTSSNKRPRLEGTSRTESEGTPVPNKDATTVSCICGKTDSNDFLMLVCKICKLHQHSSCYKVTDRDDSEHVCLHCAGAVISETDKEMSLFRRALSLCASCKSVSLRKLMQDLQVESTKAIALMRRLQRDKVLRKSTIAISSEKPEFLYSVNKEALLQSCYPKYFGSQQD